MRCGGVEYPGAHPPLIDRALWDQVNAIRARRTKQRGGEVPAHGQGGLLSELAYCGHCGERLHSWWTGNVPNRVHRYYCSARRKFGPTACEARMLRSDRIEATVLDLLRALTIPRHIARGVIAEVERRLTQPASPQHIDVGRVREQLRRLRAAYLAGDPDLNDQLYARERDRLSKLLATERPAVVRVLDVEKAISFLGNMPALINAATYTEQRALIQQVIKQVWLTREGIAGWEPAPNYRLLVEVVAAQVGGTTSAGLHPAPSTATVSSKPLIAPRWIALNTPIVFSTA